MFKSILIFALVIVAVFSADEKYTTKYDNIDLDAIVGNKRLLEQYCKCLLDQGPCTEEGQVLKDVIVDALETGCSKCSDKQKQGVEKTFPRLKENVPDCYKNLSNKYDPEGKYREKYNKLAEEKGVKI